MSEVVVKANIQMARMAKTPPLNAGRFVHFQAQVQPAIRVLEKRSGWGGSQFKLVPKQSKQLKEKPVFVERRHITLASTVNVFATFPSEFRNQIELEPGE